MKIRLSIIITLVLFSGIAFSQNEVEKVSSSDITKEEIYEHVKYLASDKLEGRFPGTNGDILTRQYISKEFQRYGLIPKGDSAFIQRFEFSTGVKEGKSNSAKFNTKSGVVELAESDFTPLGLSAPGKVSGELVFAGYGINTPTLDYTDFKDAVGNPVNVEGKVIVIMRYSPTTMNMQNDKFAKFEDLRTKISLFKELKPAGVIVVTPPINSTSSNTDILMDANFEMTGQNSGIPVINVKRGIIEKILQQAGYDLSQIQSGINENIKPNCFEIKDVTAEFVVDLEKDIAKTGNVVGFLEGNDPVLKNEVIVIGAHFDHLGYGGQNSMYRGKEKLIHYGADDNASGTTGVLEVAQKLASQKDKLKRSVLFVCFTAEELGLIGSSYFAKSDEFKKYNTVAMLNMDMVGRLNNDKLILNGTGTSAYWVPEIEKLNKNYDFKISMNPEGFGPSDHSSFYAKDIPVLMFFTDLHSDYHKPADTYDKINTDGQQKVLQFVYDMAYDLSTRSDKPGFIKVTVKEDENKGERKSVRVYVGTVPDFSYSDPGYKISGVQAGSPAEKAGVLAGDIMVKFGDKEIKDLYDYTAALGEYKPGQEVNVVLKRGNEEVTVTIKLGSK